MVHLLLFLACYSSGLLFGRLSRGWCLARLDWSRSYWDWLFASFSEDTSLGLQSTKNKLTPFE